MKIVTRESLIKKSIAVAGLSISWAIIWLTVSYIVFETSYDSFNSNSDRVYALFGTLDLSGNIRFMDNTTPEYKETMQNRFPEIEAVGRCKSRSVEFSVAPENTLNSKCLYIDPEFVGFLDFKPVIGNVEGIIDKNSVILTESFALTSFGDMDCIGKQLSFEDESYTVCAIIEDFPANTNFDFDVLASMNSYLETVPPMFRHVIGVDTYILTRMPLENVSRLEYKIGRYLKKNMDDRIEEVNLVELGKLHQFANPDRKSFILFGSISLLILIIGTANFIFIMSGYWRGRVHDLGVRKVFGSSRKSIATIILKSCFSLLLLSLFSGFLLSMLILPRFSAFLEIDLSLIGPGLYLIYFILIGLYIVYSSIIGGILSLKYSSVKASEALWSTNTRSVKLIPSRLFITTEIGLSFGVIFICLVMAVQIKHLLNYDVKYDLSDRILVNVPEELKTEFNTISKELMDLPGVESVTGRYKPYGEVMTIGIMPENETSAIMSSGLCIQKDFMKTYGIHLLEGKDLSSLNKRDSSKIMIDEYTAEFLNMDEPVGKKLTISSTIEAEIVGVVPNIDFTGMHGERQPLVINNLLNNCKQLTIKYSGDLHGVLKGITNCMREFDKGFNMEYELLEESHKRLYKSEFNQISTMLVSLVLALFLASFGLYAAAAYNAMKNRKEIALRKVNGASAEELQLMLHSRMLPLIIIASIMTSPVALFISKQWLQSFSSRIYIGPVFYLASFVFTSTLVGLTLYYYNRSISLTNPITVLSSE